MSTPALNKEEIVMILLCIRERRDRLQSVITVTELSDRPAQKEDLSELRAIVRRCNEVIVKLGSTP